MIKNLFIFALTVFLSSFAPEASATNLLSQGEGGYRTSGHNLIVMGLESETTDKYIIESTYSPASATLNVFAIGNGSSPVVASGYTEHTEIEAVSLTINANAQIKAYAFSTWTGLKTLTIGATQATPLTLGTNALPEQFAKENSECVIIVPSGMLEAYATSEQWKQYANIIQDAEGNKYQSSEKPSAISNVRKSSMNVSGHNILFDEATSVKVYNLCGQEVYSGVTTRASVNRSGVYIVRTATESRKIIVK